MKRVLCILVLIVLLTGCGGGNTRSLNKPPLEIKDISSPQVAVQSHTPGETGATSPEQSAPASPVASTAGTTSTPSPIPLPPSGNWQITVENSDLVTLLSTTRGAVPGRIFMMTWSPDGKLLAVAGSGGALLLDGFTLQTLQELDLAAPATNFSFSRDGQRLAIGGMTRTVQVWDVPGKKMIQVLSEAGQFVFLSPDGKLLAALDDNAVMDSDFNTTASKVEIRIFQVETGKMLSEFSDTTAMVWQNPIFPETVGGYFSTDGRIFQAANNLGDVRAWDVYSGKLLGTSINEQTRMRLSTGICAASENSGQSFALVCEISYMDPPCNEDVIGCNPVARWRYDIGLWETNQLKRSTNIVYRDPFGSGLYLFYDPGQRLVSMLDSLESKIYLPAPNGTAAVQTLHPAWSALVKKLKCENCPFPITRSPDGARLAASNGQSITMLELETGESVQASQENTSILTSAALGILNGQPVLAAGYSDGLISYILPGSGESLGSDTNTGENPVTGLFFAAEDVLSLNNRGMIQLWQPGDSKPKKTYQTMFALLTFKNSHRFLYSPAAGLVLVDAETSGQSWPRTPQLEAYDLRADSPRFAISDKPDALAFSADGRWLALGKAHQAAIYNTSKGELLREFSLQGTGRTVSGVALNVDGSLLSVAESGTASILNVNTKEVIAQVQEENFTASLVEFDPAGCLLAVGSVEGRILLADVASGQVLARLPRHAGEVTTLAFSQDGRLLLSVGIDHRAQIWGQIGALKLPSGEMVAQSCHLGSVPATSTPAPTATPVPPTPTPTQASFIRNLYLADPMMYGGDILQLQQRLYALGYTGVGSPDGWFGPKTDQAVRAFQERNNLVVDGVVGRITWSHLFSENAIRQ